PRPTLFPYTTLFRSSDAIEWHGRRISEYDSIDWTALLDGAGYSGLGRADVEWEQTIDRELLAARIRSVSYIAEKPADEQQEYVEDRKSTRLNSSHLG